MQLIPSTAWGRPAESAGSTGGASHRWGLHAVASAVVLATSLTASSAWALALGRVQVQSPLGQPLRAEIDLPNISDAEASSLQVGVASAETFRAAGMELNPLLNEVRFILERRPNGRSVLRLTSERVVNEPFLDVVVDVNWANGHLVRGYTMLFDPPNLKAPAPLLPAAASVTPTPAPAASPRAATPPEVVAPRAAAPAPVESAPPAEAPSKVNVRSGDTAGRIAQANKPASATLEQMLIGLLRANPHAFIGSNVNRMKAGVVLDMPTEAAVTEVSASEARRLIAVQSKDFNEYRRRLAEVAPDQGQQEASRSASGTVQAEVSEPQAAAPTPDKLTLSKGSVKAADNAEAKIASERQQAETSNRQGELNRNLEELKKLEAAAATPAPAPEAPPVADAKENGPAVESSAAAPAPAAPPAPPAAPPAAPAPQPEAEAGIGGFVQSLLDNPMALPAAGGLAALAALLVGLRIVKRRKAAAPADEPDIDESMMEAGGGQIVDTDEAAAGPVSSMMYSPSQLDAGGDVDPIAEADVYLAYGRDKQAEEILLEALRLHPDRLNVRLKLLEIYAQRRDLVAFAGTATEVFQMTEGQGADWEHARSLGHSIDPTNSLYQPNAAAAASLAGTDVKLDLKSAEPAVAPSVPAPDFPDLDMALSSEPTPAETPAPAPAADHSLDFDLDLSEMTPAPAAAAPAAAPVVDEGFDLDFDLDLSTSEPEAPALQTPSALPADVQDLSLDLETPTEQPTEQLPEEATEPDFDMLSNLEVDEGGNSGDPLETKLSLAQEFEAIGDTEGARSLAEEVVAEATGELKARAQAFLSQLP